MGAILGVEEGDFVDGAQCVLEEQLAAKGVPVRHNGALQLVPVPNVH